MGEIWVDSASKAQGYWNLPELSQESFRAQILPAGGSGTGRGAGAFLRTGDLGFLRNGELFICGRLKDLIIVRGSNHYPQDLERAAERSHPGLVSTFVGRSMRVPIPDKASIPLPLCATNSG